MQRLSATLACAFLLAGCSSEPFGFNTPESLAAEVLSDSATKDAAANYFQCVTELSRLTPNGPEALDLNRIQSVLKGCRAENTVLIAAVQQRWPPTADTYAENRRRGLLLKSVQSVRQNPFEPRSVLLEGR